MSLDPYENVRAGVEYVRRKYGDDHVAQIVTFGTMAARAAIRDVGRALNMTYAEVDVVAKLVPGVGGREEGGVARARALGGVLDVARLEGAEHDDVGLGLLQPVQQAREQGRIAARPER